MKTKEKTSVGKVSQVVFRPSVERRGYYRFHYGHLAPDGTFVEASDLSFSEYLGSIGVPAELVAAFVEGFCGSESELCGFGYLSQNCFDEFVRVFVDFCDTVQLYPGMLVLTFKEEENEG